MARLTTAEIDEALTHLVQRIRSAQGDDADYARLLYGYADRILDERLEVAGR